MWSKHFFFKKGVDANKHDKNSAKLKKKKQSYE